MTRLEVPDVSYILSMMAKYDRVFSKDRIQCMYNGSRGVEIMMVDYSHLVNVDLTALTLCLSVNRDDIT